jgi:hypothetical protein
MIKSAAGAASAVIEHPAGQETQWDWAGQSSQ